MLRVTYKRIEDSDRAYYADTLREKFGGVSVRLDDTTAAFCAERSWCPSGGAAVIYSKSYFGNPNDRAFAAWKRSDRKLRDALIAIDNPTDEQYNEFLLKRWKNMFAFANRRAARLKAARAKVKAAKAKKPARKK